ncbi:MAG: hypothetical protein A2806_01695 [Candidatus Terrybacteria bacterium RIFCSPHIGHO2_01_FULL_48_17]|uniref:valine--tRNA ligase n=1 Tax=Candidatus Terrybacteria bacterium RIFCSPHIGHO2_01_FULL_48_17 TaxID=1802362 RepID=A0A1G2PL70_9BACT|nr:MAG: hypothetical protein A2806_01695 [Candidatus Terrybacteria bacterium RIFCSPHIGHO2_01_FULL_48_17]OHA52677.1 MAG: hypothetical protein A3A30_03600 [Candidatus Terrybacteria bacterium RIFCSPLOWO2_01_FULL_48_14]
MELPKAYNPMQTEEKIYRIWEKSGFFNPDNLPGKRRENFVVMMPPPNITGSLHLGHALEAAATDCLIRMKRMQGYRTLYFPGTDHAGIATQNKVEKELKKEGLGRHDLGREKFLERVWTWREKYGGIILEQFKKLGTSADWSRQRFTMDKEYVKAVEAAFMHYYDKGWIYKGERVVHFCTRCATSLSDLELEYKEEQGKLWYIKYPIGGQRSEVGNQYIVVATTRPETMLGDTAVAVHPDDTRYKALIGKTVELPLAERIIPIIADTAVEQEFGTGAVKVTPAHDFIDANIGERHELSRIKIIGEDGRITPEAPKKYHGMKVKEARETVVEDLTVKGFLEKTEDYTHNVAICYRCETPIEPLPSPQWFLKMKELTQTAKRAYQSGRVRIAPERFRQVAIEWLDNERDWCISRQLWWGHQIPIPGEKDVLDTWFSSALWPFATLGWPEKTKGLETYYPTQWMTCAREILNLWIERMVFSGLEFMGKEPYAEIWIHPTVLTKEGKRMSKSLGTGIDPLELIRQYGADAIRFGLLWQITGLQDIKFDESALIAGKKFLNKIWNAARFVLHHTEKISIPETPPISEHKEDQKILASLNVHISRVEKEIAILRFGQALEIFYSFFWHEFCDEYLEHAKQRTDVAAKETLLWVLTTSLKILHPFIPFITEELWGILPHGNKPSLLMVAEWPASSNLEIRD